jgi:hypothetical protein
MGGHLSLVKSEYRTTENLTENVALNSSFYGIVDLPAVMARLNK